DGIGAGRNVAPLRPMKIETRPLGPAPVGAPAERRLSAATGVPSLWQKVQVSPQASPTFARRVVSSDTTTGTSSARGAGAGAEVSRTEALCDNVRTGPEGRPGGVLVVPWWFMGRPFAGQGS